MLRKIKSAKSFIIIYPIFIIVLFLIISEIVFRMYFNLKKLEINNYRPSFFFSDRYSADRNRFKSHPFLPFMTIPNDKRIIYMYKPAINTNVKYDYTNNSLGFRTPERPFEKAQDVKRIITLGGSTTWDGPTNDKTWPAILEQKLNDYYNRKNIKIEVINLALDAGISPMSLNILNMIGIHYSPDIVISYDGINEIWPTFYWQNVIPDYSNFIRPFNDKIESIQMKLPKWIFHSYAVTFISNRLDRILKNDVSLTDQVWKRTEIKTDNTIPSPLDLFKKNLKLMNLTCKEFGCKFIASTPHWDTVDERTTLFCDETRKFLSGEKIDFLDLDKLIPHSDINIHNDGIHWTEKGLEIMSDEWYKKIIGEDLFGLNPVSSRSAMTVSAH